MSRRSVHLTATVAFQVPRDVDDRLRAESDHGSGALADIDRRYLLAGIAATDAGRKLVDAELMDGPTVGDAEALGKSSR